FQAAAVRYSDGPNALEGGDLGWRSPDEIPSAFANVVGGMQAGQVFGPVRGPSGFQLLQLRGADDAAGAAPAQLVTQFPAARILVRGADPAATARADALHARVVGGEDLAAVAREESEDAVTRGQGGDLGWFAQDDFGPQF